MDSLIQQPENQMITPREAAIRFHNEAINVGLQGGDQNKNLAYRLFCSSADVDNTFHPAWFQIGVANADMHLGEASVAACRRALEIEPNNVLSLVNLGHQLYHLGRHEEATIHTMRALEVDPDNHLALCNLSIIQSTQGKLDESLESARRAYEISPLPVIEFALAMAYLKKRQWSIGLKHLEARFGYAKRMQHFLSLPYVKWSGQSLKGKILYLVADQGLGDTISMFRFLKRLDDRAGFDGGKIVAHFQPDLLRLCNFMFANPSAPESLLNNTTIGPLPQPYPAADYWCSTTCIAVALGLNDEEIESAQQPVVPLLPSPSNPTWKAPGRRLHVGVAWGGSVDNDIDRHRSFPVQMLLELHRAKGVQLYSLQCGPRSQELQLFGGGGIVRDLSPFIRDVVDTLSIMRELDVIVTVESSPLHMAQLLGIETYLPYSRDGSDWRCGYGDQGVLWGPKTRVFKQDDVDNPGWLSTFRRIAKALEERIGPL